jgi:MSHA pilin protein MshC
MKNSGFTLIELVVTMVIIGILAVVALPRIFDTTAFDNRRFSDEVMAAVRYGQKTAVASRRNVCVAFADTKVTLTIAGAPGPAQLCNLNLTGPNGIAPFVVTAPDGTNFAALPTDFFFNALGRPSIGTQTIQVAGAATSIVVEQESGYVHP